MPTATSGAETIATISSATRVHDVNGTLEEHDRNNSTNVESVSVAEANATVVVQTRLEDEVESDSDSDSETESPVTRTEVGFDTDKLQLLHALTNLALAYEANFEANLKQKQVNEPELRLEIEQLKSRAQNERNRYTRDMYVRVTQETHRVTKAQSDIDFGMNDWVLTDLVDHIQNSAKFDEHDFLESIKARVSPDGGNSKDSGGARNMIRDLTSIYGLKYVINNSLVEMKKMREQLISQIKSLQKDPTASEVESQASCQHCRFARTSTVTTKPCIFCVTEAVLIKYEPLIFSHGTMVKGEKMTKEQNDTNNNAVKDLGHQGFFYLSKTSHKDSVSIQGPSVIEQVVRAIGVVYKKAHGDEGNMKRFLAHIGALKKEFFALRVLFGVLHERVGKLDELAMCNQRLRVLTPGMKVADGEKFAYAKTSEFGQKLMEFRSMEVEMGEQLKRSWGQLNYLQTIQASAKSGEKMKCPVCIESLQGHYVVLACGHSYCASCLDLIMKRGNVRGGPGSRASPSITCSLCRQQSPISQIEQVITSSVASSSDPEVVDQPIKGDHSAKINAIVQTLMQLQLKDLSTKSIVFSQWPAVLHLIEIALEMNGVPCLRLAGTTKKDQQLLQKFKSDSTIKALLMPTQRGGMGLNLTEATHVILVEPLLDAGVEAQAIGRIHRIGQTKETFVHRYVTRSSVEETIMAFLKKPSQSSAPQSPTKKRAKTNDTGMLTLGSLKAMFMTPTSATSIDTSSLSSPSTLDLRTQKSNSTPPEVTVVDDEDEAAFNPNDKTPLHKPPQQQQQQQQQQQSPPPQQQQQQQQQQPPPPPPPQQQQQQAVLVTSSDQFLTPNQHVSINSLETNPIFDEFWSTSVELIDTASNRSRIKSRTEMLQLLEIRHHTRVRHRQPIILSSTPSDPSSNIGADNNGDIHNRQPSRMPTSAITLVFGKLIQRNVALELLNLKVAEGTNLVQSADVVLMIVTTLENLKSQISAMADHVNNTVKLGQ